MDHRSFRDQLAFSPIAAICCAGSYHVTDDARQMLAERGVEHLEQSGFEIDEAE